MQTLDRDELSIHMDAPPDAVYAVISDVTRTPEYSPEVAACIWLDGVTSPAIGARFTATNKVNGLTWRNKPVITTMKPGEEFAFARTEPFAGTVVWRYRLRPEDGGTRVEESYEVVRPIKPIGWFIIGTLGKDSHRRVTMHNEIQKSLERLRTLVEKESAAQV